MKLGFIGIGIGQMQRGAPSSPYGPELVTDGGFALGISQVTAKRSAVLTWDNSNSLMVAYGGSAEPQGWLTLNTTPGKTFQVTLAVTQSPASAILRAYADNQTTILNTASGLLTGDRTFTFVATGVLSYLSLGANIAVAGATIFDNVSAREVL